MKKKTMKRLFITFFIIGLVVGWLLPGNLKSFTVKPLDASVLDVPKKLGQLEVDEEGLKYTVLAGSETSNVRLLRFDEELPESKVRENRYYYVYKGYARVTIGDFSEDVKAGSLVVVPSGEKYSFVRTGDSPVEVLELSTFKPR